MSRPAFTLKTMFWGMALVAAFLGGAGWQHRVLSREIAGDVEQYHNHLDELEMYIFTLEEKAAAGVETADLPASQTASPSATRD